MKVRTIKNVEKILDPKDRILDTMASWENAPLVEEIKVESRVKKSRRYKHKDQNKQVKEKKKKKLNTVNFFTKPN